VQPDGKIVLLGSGKFGAGWDILVWRLLADGSADASFGNGGVVRISLDGTRTASSDELPSRIAPQADGKLLVAGSIRPLQGGNEDWFVCRLTATGQLDPSYGPPGAGVVKLALDSGGSNDDQLVGAAPAPGGGLFLAGNVATGSGTLVVLAKLDANGALDPAFGFGGTRRLGDEGNVQDLVVTAAPGPWLIGGFGGNPTGEARAFALDGSDLTAFGTQGKVTFNVQAPADLSHFRLVPAGGKLVIGGYSLQLEYGIYTFAVRLLLQ
jgi:uncharacterized delta-60 repeat protein